MERLRQRLKQLQSRLKGLGCDGLLVDDEVNLRYLTGLHLSNARLLVTAKEAQLMVDGRYAEGARERSFYPVVVSDEDGIKKLLLLAPFKGISRLGFNEESSYRSYLELQRLTSELSPPVALVPLPNPLYPQRIIKDPEEEQTLRQAAKLGAEGFDYICSLLREGITEQELTIELEIFWRRRGGKKLAFDPIIAFEPRSSEPHYTASDIGLRKGQSVLIDIGVNVDDYHSDMTRVVFFGPPNPKILEIYQIVWQAQKAALKLCRPGTSVGDIDAAAREIIGRAGYAEAFTHSLGHGVGLEIHEPPRLRDKEPFRGVQLEPRMVVTVEPGIYLPGIGGVRIEDTILITDAGYEDLTLRSKEPLVL